ncbi:hypothetical protein DFH29DRAFT_1026604 [Suillus ampliporus]|nr:hypothetical protein DFH29DRAFT_1026604 [Suillus ampliporus]
MGAFKSLPRYLSYDTAHRRNLVKRLIFCHEAIHLTQLLEKAEYRFVAIRLRRSVRVTAEQEIRMRARHNLASAMFAYGWTLYGQDQFCPEREEGPGGVENMCPGNHIQPRDPLVHFGLRMLQISQVPKADPCVLQLLWHPEGSTEDQHLVVPRQKGHPEPARSPAFREQKQKGQADTITLTFTYHFSTGDLLRWMLGTSLLPCSSRHISLNVTAPSTDPSPTPGDTTNEFGVLENGDAQVAKVSGETATRRLSVRASPSINSRIPKQVSGPLSSGGIPRKSNRDSVSFSALRKASTGSMASTASVAPPPTQSHGRCYVRYSEIKILGSSVNVEVAHQSVPETMKGGEAIQVCGGMIHQAVGIKRDGIFEVVGISTLRKSHIECPRSWRGGKTASDDSRDKLTRQEKQYLPVATKTSRQLLQGTQWAAGGVYGKDSGQAGVKGSGRARKLMGGKDGGHGTIIMQ